MLKFVILSLLIHFSIGTDVPAASCQSFSKLQTCLYNKIIQPQQVMTDITSCASSTGCTVPGMRAMNATTSNPTVVANLTGTEVMEEVGKCMNDNFYPTVFDLVESCVQKQFSGFMLPRNLALYGAKDSTFFDHKFNHLFANCHSDKRMEFKKCIDKSTHFKSQSSICEAEKSCSADSDGCTIEDLRKLVCKCATDTIPTKAEEIGGQLRKCVALMQEPPQEVTNSHLASRAVDMICDMGGGCELERLKEETRRRRGGHHRR